MEPIFEDLKSTIANNNDSSLNVSVIAERLKSHLNFNGSQCNELAQLLHNHDEKPSYDKGPYLQLEKSCKIGAYEKVTPLYLIFPLAANNCDPPATIMQVYMDRWNKVVNCGCSDYLTGILDIIKDYVDTEISPKEYVESFYFGVTSAVKPKGQQDQITLDNFTKGFFNRLNVTYGQHGYTHMICINALEYDRYNCRYPCTENLRLEESLFYHYSNRVNNVNGKFEFLPRATVSNRGRPSKSAKTQKETVSVTVKRYSSAEILPIPLHADPDWLVASKILSNPTSTALVKFEELRRAFPIFACGFSNRKRSKSASTHKGCALEPIEYWKPGGGPDGRAVDCYFFLYVVVKLTADAREKLCVESGLSEGLVIIQPRTVTYPLDPNVIVILSFPSTAYRCPKCAKNLVNIESHLQTEHNLIIVETRYKCTKCKNEMDKKASKKHECKTVTQ